MFFENHYLFTKRILELLKFEFKKLKYKYLTIHLESIYNISLNSKIIYGSIYNKYLPVILQTFVNLADSKKVNTRPYVTELLGNT